VHTQTIERQLTRSLSRRSFLTSLAIGAAGLLVACGQADNGDAGSSGNTNVTPSASGAGSPVPTVTSTPCPAIGSPGSDAVETCGPPLTHPLGADELVLRFDMGGGFVAPAFQVTQLPIFSLYGDGSVVTQGPQIMIYPGPALPNLLVTRLTEAGVQAVLRAAVEAGLTDGDHTWQSAGVADAPTTTITANVNGRTSVTAVYALGIDSPQPDTTQAERDARAKILALQTQLGALRGWLPPAAIQGDDQPFEIKRLQFVTQPADEIAPTAGSPTGTPDDTSVQPSHAPWPLSAQLADWGIPYTLLNSRCGVVEGADLAPMLAALRQANQLTQWESAGHLYTAYIRPLLPDEAGCAATTG
jgi:hypothetical protein